MQIQAFPVVTRYTVLLHTVAPLDPVCPRGVVKSFRLVGRHSRGRGMRAHHITLHGHGISSARAQFACTHFVNRAGPTWAHQVVRLRDVHVQNELQQAGGIRDPSKVNLSKQLTLKVPASMNMTTELYTYLLQHTREPQILKELREETAVMNGSHMQITADQGQLLALMVQLMGARKVVEVGVYTGYSSLAVAMALADDAKLYALDKDARSMAVARKYWEKAGVTHKVVEKLGSGADSLKSLLSKEGPCSIDMAFIDADKRAYWEYFELLLQLVRPGGLIIADNVLFYGKVASPEASDKAAIALADFNDRLLLDQRIDLSIIPVGDGMALCRKR